MQKFESLLIVLCLFVSLLAGCGGDIVVSDTDATEINIEETVSTEPVSGSIELYVSEDLTNDINEVETTDALTEPVAMDGIETVPVETETDPVEIVTEFVEIATEPVLVAPSNYIPDGNGIYLDARFIESEKTVDFAYPLESDFGADFDKAVAIYDGIMNGSEFVTIVFDIDGTSDIISDIDTSVCSQVESAWIAFRDLFNQKVLCDAVALQTFSESYYSGDIVVWTSCVPTDLTENITLLNIYYDCNVAAGLYDGMSEKAAVKAINSWICRMLSYSTANSSPEDAVATGVGNCAAYAGLFEGMCDNAGIVCEQIVGYAVSGSNEGYHSWNRVCVGGNWYYVDVCWNDTCGNSSKYLFSETLWSSHTEY